MSEFNLIARYFTRATPGAVLGVGDDAALLRVGAGMELAVSTDMLVADTHFLPDADPYLLGRKTLAVNLSDMAAMGATPRWATLALSLPQADDAWLQKFSTGFFSIADEYRVELIGGDTTRGSLNMSVTIMGEVPAGAALRRAGAQIGDDIWVSGRLGDAALALAHMQGVVQLTDEEFKECAPALHDPQPRVMLGLVLRGIAHSAIDVSDGLLADLGHILESSGVGAEITYAKLPVSKVMAGHLESPLGQHCVLGGGDDYELCFTTPLSQRAMVQGLETRINLPLTHVGAIVAGSTCKLRTTDGTIMKFGKVGYDHF